MTDEDIFFFKNLGMYLTPNKQTMDNFNSLFYDFLHGFFSLVLVIISRKHFNDINAKQYTQDESTRRLLHPHFNRHLNVITLATIIALVIIFIIMQTIFEAFIVLLVFLKLLLWAYNESDERNETNFYVLTGA